jgi:hypothetical protein
MQTLRAFDLTELPRADSLWRKRHDSHGEPSASHAARPAAFNLPVEGFPSSLGFWFAASDAWTNGPPRLTLEFFDADESEQTNRSERARARDATTKGRTVRARLKTLNGRAPAGKSPLPLLIEIDANVARIKIDAGAWASVGETVLFAVAQYWRLAAIDRTLDELSDWARDDLENNNGFTKVISRRRATELRARRRVLEKLILDLPEYEGSLTNPRRHFPSVLAVALYRRLCAQLGLHRRRREIDERVEVVESIFDSLTDSLNHFQSLAFQIVLELAIVALLLLDVGLYFVDAFF